MNVMGSETPCGLAALGLVIVVLLVLGIHFVDKAADVDKFVNTATFEDCYVTSVEEVDCDNAVSYLYEAFSEKCGDQTLEFNTDFKTCKSGDDHRYDVGQHKCYVDDDCNEFIWESTASKSGGWMALGISLLVLGSCGCIITGGVAVFYLRKCMEST